MIPKDGGDTDVISNVEVHSWAASWSPDGTKLMFSENTETSPVIYDLLIDTLNAYGGADPIYDTKWAPDGSKVVGWSNKNLVIYDFDKGEIETAIENTPPYHPYWAADSKHVYLVDSWMKEEQRSVYKLRLHDKRMEKIVRVGGERMAWGTDAQWVGVTPEGIVMFLRDHSIHNIYALEWDPE